MVHSDGDVSEIIPDLIEMGVQILNPLQPEAMDVLEIKRQYGSCLCFNGGISSQHTLPLGSPGEVTAEVQACLRGLGRSGGYIAGPTKTVTAEIPLENAIALLETLVNQPPDRATADLDAVEGSKDDTEVALRRVYRVFHPESRTNSGR
jgi:uroporphyrinogen decarboxylase